MKTNMKKQKEKIKDQSKKKATISVDFIITLIILLIGFVILLIFLYNTYWHQNVDRETCHESVIFRATLPNIVEQSIPLKCKTNKVCITAGSGECPEFSGEGKGITTLKISSGEVGIEQIEKFYANEIIDCWSMLGEGKVSLFYSFAERYGLGKIASSCVVCTRIAFDKQSLMAAGVDLNKINLQDYMLTHFVENKDVTYYQYLAGNNGLFDLGDKEFKVMPVNDASNRLVENSGGTLAPNEIRNIQQADSSDLFKSDSILFMQISSPEHGEALQTSLKDLGLVWGSGVLLAPKMALGATTTLAKSWYFWGAAALAGLYQQGSIAWNRGISARYCGDMTVGGEGRGGCSVVRVVNYDAEDISKYCNNIEGLP